VRRSRARRGGRASDGAEAMALAETRDQQRADNRSGRSHTDEQQAEPDAGAASCLEARGGAPRAGRLLPTRRRGETVDTK
jgi:hypothetical protein